MLFLKLLGHLKPGDAIASMGYPDLLYPVEKLAEVVPMDRVKIREDSTDICHRHGKKAKPVPDAESLFEALEVSLDVYDITQERGCEIVLDLNEPFPENSREQYEHVLDVGTLEHCFNVGQAVFNMAGLLKVGGRIYHENPFNWGNHGFYGLNPTWYHDFYAANGFEVEECCLVDLDGGQSARIDTKRFHFNEKEANCLAVARRIEAKPFVYPMQTKYRSSQCPSKTESP